MSYSNAGRVWSAEGFREYIEKLGAFKLDWCVGVCVHHTAFPHLAMRPDGWSPKLVENLKNYYSKEKGWSAGPHGFTDKDEIWGMSPFTAPGTHARKFNANYIGIEVLGDYDYKDDPLTGRGLDCFKMAAIATYVILDVKGLPINSTTVTFHRDNGITSKTCPGTKVSKEWYLSLIREVGSPVTSPVGTLPGVDVVDEKPDLPNLPNWSEWRLVHGFWCVPVNRFMQAMGDPDPASTMTLKEGELYYRGDRIEMAFYDREAQETWAPAVEVLNLME